MFKRGRESTGKKEIEGRTTGRGGGGRVRQDWGEKGERGRGGVEESRTYQLPPVSPAFLNKGFDGAEKQEAVLNT